VAGISLRRKSKPKRIKSELEHNTMLKVKVNGTRRMRVPKAVHSQNENG